MAYDEKLAARVRGLLRRRRDVRERPMFGGLAFLVRGHMACGVLGDNLVLKLGNRDAALALRRKHTRPMDFTGTPLRSMIYVRPLGYRRLADLRAWVERAVRHARALPST